MTGGSEPGKRSIKWQWKKGADVLHGAFGDPAGSTSFALCVYDSVASEFSLSASIQVAPGTGWTDKDPKGWVFVDKTGAQSGVNAIKLVPGDAGKSRVSLKAKGASVPVPAAVGQTYFSQNPALTVQLLSSDGECWTSDFDAASTTKSTAESFKAVVK